MVDIKGVTPAEYMRMARMADKIEAKIPILLRIKITHLGLESLELQANAMRALIRSGDEYMREEEILLATIVNDIKNMAVKLAKLQQEA